MGGGHEEELHTCEEKKEDLEDAGRCRHADGRGVQPRRRKHHRATHKQGLMANGRIRTRKQTVLEGKNEGEVRGGFSLRVTTTLSLCLSISSQKHGNVSQRLRPAALALARAAYLPKWPETTAHVRHTTS